MESNTWHRLLHRQASANKYDLGHILIIGGSPHMTGAPVLAARAALRTGAGLVTIASDAKTIELIDRDIAEIMTLSLPPWAEKQKVIATVAAFVHERQVKAVIIGPGLPAETDSTVRALVLSMAPLPIIVDAEAIRAFHGHFVELGSAGKSSNVIMTPHPGEFAAATGIHPADVAGNEKAILQDFARQHHLVVVLKHAHTLIAGPDGVVRVNKTGNPGLATAGSGDVLSGVIAAIVAQKMTTYEAAVMGVYVHGLAGDIAAASKTQPGMIASDVIEALPQALKTLDH